MSRVQVGLKQVRNGVELIRKGLYQVRMGAAESLNDTDYRSIDLPLTMAMQATNIAYQLYERLSDQFQS